jgi:GT2 family glycosyltransferase
MQQQTSPSFPTGTANPVWRICTIIIPVYNAFGESLACLRSVLRYTPPQHNILVVDDCSPEGRFEDVVPSDFLDDPRLTIQRNPENLGFVKTCNLAMRQSVPFDVILLNSDTEVTPNWLDKLQMATYSRPEIGTATPLTNRGTICSVPEFLADNDLPPGYSLHEFAAMVESVSLRKYPKLPTCVGFCVYIKREVIDRIGVFDEESFGKGYGEENDFSCRLQAAGYVDILDDATFVYHHGSTSFQSQASTLAAEHLKILSRKHPKYLWQVDQFIASGSLRDIHHRIHRAMLRRWCEKSRY